jgi:DNA-binding winged helix-turn-helix (wHTH) protein
MTADESPMTVDLAGEAPFRLGQLEVRPSTRQVISGADCEVLEPRVMQVLTALARRGGQVVSRDELIAACWGGRHVGADAINRCVHAIRKLADAYGGFSITTIARVGYRLETTPTQKTALHEAARQRSRLPTAWVAASAAAVLAATVAFALVTQWGKPPTLATPLVEVRPLGVIGDDPVLRPFAARAADQVSAFLGDSDVRVVTAPAHVGPASAQLAFSGAVSSDGSQLSLHLVLEDTRTNTTLWSRDYAQPASRADALIDEAKGGAMEAANLVRAAYGPSGLLDDSETLLLGMRGGEESVLPTSEARSDAVHDTQLALARHPSSGVLHAAYASELASAGLVATPNERVDIFRRARAEAERTIREHPEASGLAYLALLVIARSEAPRDFVDGQSRLDAALKAAPEDPFLDAYACGFLQIVGRAADSLLYCQRALALQPHTAPFLSQYAAGLDMAGQPDQADAVLEEGSRLYPNSEDIRFYRFAREAFSGSPDKALMLLHDRATLPILTTQVPAIELLEKARTSGRASDADAAMASLRIVDARLPLDGFRVAFPMSLGRLDDAFNVPDIKVFELDNAYMLTWPAMDRLRRDPRFWPVAARAGLVRYWLATNKWPDFCSDHSYPLDCRAEARRVAGMSTHPG